MLQNKIKATIATLILMMPLLSCEKEESPKEKPDEEEVMEVDWSAAADSATDGLIDQYWNAGESYFNYTNRSNEDFHYWPQAHALDVVLDAYVRTDDDHYLQYINQWYEGVNSQNGNTFLNDFYDDMEWNALAMLRAWQMTDDSGFKEAALTLWEDILTGWNEHAEGGIMWRKGAPYGKNACSNGPAAILGARLYQSFDDEEYLDWALKIYSWEKNLLFDDSSGAIWDSVTEENGTLNFNKDWIFTYNQGTFVGASIELYEITGKEVYLEDAVKAADYTLRFLVDPDTRLLKSEGDGDGGLFKGIFIRYFTQLILHPDLSEDDREKYVGFLERNAVTLWTKGMNKDEILFGADWKRKPAYSVDLTTQLSGVMLMEAAALLEQEGILE
ncbi:MAG: glycoside hydrolase family 76 protein [Bacteroidota bacterium]